MNYSAVGCEVFWFKNKFPPIVGCLTTNETASHMKYELKNVDQAFFGCGRL